MFNLEFETTSDGQKARTANIVLWQVGADGSN
jgi:hypothetical protein